MFNPSSLIEVGSGFLQPRSVLLGCRLQSHASLFALSSNSGLCDVLPTTPHLHIWVLNPCTRALTVLFGECTSLWNVAFVSNTANSRARRAEDYWRGYKLFCFAYYSHSLQHVREFRESKLGATSSSLPCFLRFLLPNCSFASKLIMRSLCSCVGFRRAGQLVWARHAGHPCPSPHAIRVTCMQLLPLLEMYCRWELKEDCSNLEALLLRYDSEAELESHKLGRALLHMIRDDAAGLPALPSRVHRQEPPEVVEDPFLAVREHLAVVDSAFRNLQPQVLTVVAYTRDFVDAGNIECAFGRCCCSCPSCSWTPLAVHKFCCSLLIQPTFRWLCCDPRPSNLLISPALAVYALIRRISSLCLLCGLPLSSLDVLCQH